MFQEDQNRPVGGSERKPQIFMSSDMIFAPNNTISGPPGQNFGLVE
jgi:hypothetical protein